MKDEIGLHSTANICGEFGQATRPILTVDVEKYQAYLDGSGLSDEQKEEFLQALWSIVVSFVELGFGVHPLQEVCGKDEPGALERASRAFDEVNSGNSQTTTQSDSGLRAVWRQNECSGRNHSSGGERGHLLPRLVDQATARRQRAGEPGAALPRLCRRKGLRRRGRFSGRCLLSYLDAQKGKPYVVIFDDLKRFARDTEFHLKLRREFSRRGATIECLNFRFEDTPEGKFIETVLAAQGELEREQNRRQVIQKMKARVESGFWVFRAPIGYRYVSARSGGGKVLVPDEQLAPIVRQALEGFATGHFASQAEVQRFVEGIPHFPKDREDGSLRPMTVARMLRKVVYAGYVEAPEWGVSVRKGQHEGLISFETYERIQEYLDGRRRRPAARKDFNEDFPLRGFVLCDCCGNAMTGGMVQGQVQALPLLPLRDTRLRGQEQVNPAREAGGRLRRDHEEA